MRLRFLAVSLVVFALSMGTGFSQTFTGTLDGYYSYNFNKPIVGGVRTNDLRAFDTRDRSFSFNYGEIAVEYKPNNVGVHVDVGFGDAAEIVHKGEPAGADIWRHIQQAYVTGTKGKLTVDFGKFVTPLGAEVIETKDNWNYTRGLLFTYAIPFYHFGGRATYALNDKVSLAGYVVNGWNNVLDNNTAKSVGFVGTFKPHSKWTLVTNILVGKESSTTDQTRTMLDGILTFNASGNLSFMANYDFGKDYGPNLLPGVRGREQDWQGFAGYFKAKLSDKVTVSNRYEVYDDREGFTTGNTGVLQSYTATAMFPWEGATFWTEFRRDWSKAGSDPFHTTSDGLFGPVQGIRGYQNTITLGLTYGFTKEVK